MAVDFTDEQQSAFDLMADLLNQYGLGSLRGELQNIILGGIQDPAQIQLQLQDTQAWKQRFVGNEKLRQAGLPVLSVAEYLSVERSYAQIMKNYGLPQGFYDDPADFGDFIGGSVSPNELQTRVQMHADLANREDPAIVQQLQSMGLTKGDILAHFIDPSRALPLLQQKYQTALIGGAARRAGVTPTTAYAQHLADIGISEQQATQGYAQIAEDLPGAELLGSIYNDEIAQSDLERETFDGDGSVTRRKKRLASQERAAFQGSAGVGQGSLSRNTAGQY